MARISNKEQISSSTNQISELQDENMSLRKELQELKDLIFDIQTAIIEQKKIIARLENTDVTLQKKCEELNRKIGPTDEWLRNTRQEMWKTKKDITQKKEFTDEWLRNTRQEMWNIKDMARLKNIRDVRQNELSKYNSLVEKLSLMEEHILANVDDRRRELLTELGAWDILERRIRFYDFEITPGRIDFKCEASDRTGVDNIYFEMDEFVPSNDAIAYTLSTMVGQRYNSNFP